MVYSEHRNADGGEPLTTTFNNSQAWATFKGSALYQWKGELQEWGLYLTSGSEGASPVLNKSLSDASKVEVEDLLTAVGALGTVNLLVQTQRLVK